MRHPLVVVVWHDAHSIGDTWMPLPFEVTPCVVESVGWLVADVKADHVVIAQSFNNTEDYDHILAIPLGMVKELRRVDLPTVGDICGVVVKAD